MVSAVWAVKRQTNTHTNGIVFFCIFSFQIIMAKKPLKWWMTCAEWRWIILHKSIKVLFWHHTLLDNNKKIADRSSWETVEHWADVGHVLARFSAGGLLWPTIAPSLFTHHELRWKQRTCSSVDEDFSYLSFSFSIFQWTEWHAPFSSSLKKKDGIIQFFFK